MTHPPYQEGHGSEGPQQAQNPTERQEPHQEPGQHPPQGHYPQQGEFTQQQIPVPPQPEQPKKQRKMSTGKIVLLAISAAVLLPIFGIAAILGISFLKYQNETNAQRVFTSETQATPTQDRVFLDDRYAKGARELKIDAAFVEPKGYTNDGSQLAVWVMPEALGWIPSNNEIRIYDVATGDVVNTYGNIAACSGMTPDDTLFCTVHGFAENGSFAQRMLVEIDLATGEWKQQVEIPTIGSMSVQYLGTSGDNDLLSLNSSDGLLSPTYSTLHALSASTGELAWTYDFEPGVEISDGCVLAGAGERVVCEVLKFEGESGGQEQEVEELLQSEEGVPLEEPLFESDPSSIENTLLVQSFDAADGEKRSQLPANSFPALGEDGWLDYSIGAGGVSIDGSSSSSSGVTLYDYEGNDISSEYAEQIEQGNGHVNLVPVPNVIGAEQIATYPLGSYMQGNSLDTLVIDAEGNPVMQNKSSLNLDPVEGPEMQRAGGGEVLFTGKPVGVTANGQAVLFQTEGMELTGGLVSVETGETILDILPGGLLPELSAELGVISYTAAEDSTMILLPGA